MFNDDYHELTAHPTSERIQKIGQHEIKCKSNSGLTVLQHNVHLSPLTLMYLWLEMNRMSRDTRRRSLGTQCHASLSLNFTSHRRQMHTITTDRRWQLFHAKSRCVVTTYRRRVRGANAELTPIWSKTLTSLWSVANFCSSSTQGWQK